MAKPNYSFEKRQRELEKKKKKEAKAHRKVSSSGDVETVDGQPSDPAAAPLNPTPPPASN